MSKYRVVSEGLRVLDGPDGPLPILKGVPVWEGDHQPSLQELREISAHQADVETEAKLGRLASGDKAEAAIEKVLGEHYYIPSHWPLVVQKKRAGGILGYKALGQCKASDLFVDNEAEFQLPPYWKDLPGKPLSPEQKKQAAKLIGLTAASSTILVGAVLHENNIWPF